MLVRKTYINAKNTYIMNSKKSFKKQLSHNVKESSQCTIAAN